MAADATCPHHGGEKLIVVEVLLFLFMKVYILSHWKDVS